MRGGSFMRYAKNVYSQNGEDGIIAEIIKRLEIKQPGRCVEFGTGNGRDLSNTLTLIEKGWSGVWIEQNEESFYKAKALGDTFGGRVEVLHGTVGFTRCSAYDDTLDNFLGKPFPREFDVLSIDIDSFDLQVWAATTEHRASIVVIEINSSIPVGVKQVHANGGPQGASFSSMLELGIEKGYQLVCHTGNLIFVDAKYRDKLGMEAFEIDHPASLFNDMWAKWAGR